MRPSALVPETMAEGDLRNARAGVHRRHCARCATSFAALSRPTSTARRHPRRAPSSSSSSSTAPTPTCSASRGGSTTRVPRRVRGADRAARSRGDERVGLPAVLGLRDPHGAWARPAAAPRARRSSRSRPASVGSGHAAVSRSCAPGARRGRASRARLGGRRRRARRQARHGGARAAAAGPRILTARAGSSSPRAASPRAAITLGSDWVTRENVFGLPLRGAPAAGEQRFGPRTSPASRWPRRGRGRRLAARRGRRERARGRRGASGSGAMAGGVGRGDRAGQRIPRREGLLDETGVEGRGMTRGVLEDLMRGSLDHCVKCTICETACPVSSVTPLFPGPKYVGPQAERYRVADEPSAESRSTTARAAGSARRSARRE